MKTHYCIAIVCFSTILIMGACHMSPSVDVPNPTATIAVAETPSPLGLKLSPTPTPLPSSTATVTSTVPVKPSINDISFIFMGETIPDGSNFNPGQTFHKTWIIKNNGAFTWSKGYMLARASSIPANEFLKSPDQILLNQEVQPGEIIDIGVDLVAPHQEGPYTVYYHLINETGITVPNSQVWVMINVGKVSHVHSENITTQLQCVSCQDEEFTLFFCMQFPDTRAWYPWNVALTVNQDHYSPSGSTINPASALTANKCFHFYFPLSPSSGMEYLLSIGKVELPPEVNQEVNCAFAQNVLQNSYLGLTFSCAGPGLFYTDLVLPSGMTEAEADQLILDAMSSTIYGPWILEGTIP